MGVCAEMKGKVSEATNRFFEARVAVMGYKCQVMLLQGQLDKKQPPVSIVGVVMLSKPHPLCIMLPLMLDSVAVYSKPHLTLSG